MQTTALTAGRDAVALASALDAPAPLAESSRARSAAPGTAAPDDSHAQRTPVRTSRSSTKQCSAAPTMAHLDDGPEHGHLRSRRCRGTAHSQVADVQDHP
jgi:hypothetical protein